MSHQTIIHQKHIMQVLYIQLNYYLISNSLRFKWQKMKKKIYFFGKCISWEILKHILYKENIKYMKRALYSNGMTFYCCKNFLFY